VRQCVLIVEDEPAIMENIRYALETEGFDTRCSVTGGGVPALLRDHRVDLIVLDIGLPDINGLDLCREIRKTHDIPIVFVTARSDEIDRVVGLEIGGDDYVVKPFSPRELAARVRAVLRRGPGRGSGAENAVSPLVEAAAGSSFAVDAGRRRITYRGAELALSRYEFNILEALIRRPEQVFSRERLMELVWDAPQSSMDRSVDAHIKNIRRKLREIRPDRDPIVTHRGIGYALRENG